MAETEKLNKFEYSKFSLIKKIILTPKKIQKTAKKLHFLE
jgi:hypothetical protein